MKTIIYFLISFIFMIGFNSCNQETREEVTTTTAEKVTYSNQGFWVEQQTIVSGNTVWGISEKCYGTGIQWRDIIALNPFLNTPERLYYNSDRKMWIVRIYPGEVLNIGGQKVYPSCTYEKITTITTTKHAPAGPIIPWWGWLISAVLVLLLLFFFVPFRSGFMSAFSSSNSSSAVHVNIRNGIDLDTRRTLLIRDQEFQDRTLRIIEQGAQNGKLKGFIINTTPESFTAAGSFRGAHKPEVPKEEDKK